MDILNVSCGSFANALQMVLHQAGINDRYSSQSAGSQSGYTIGSSGEFKLDQFLIFDEDVTEGTPRTLDIVNGSLANPLGETPARIKTLKIFLLVCFRVLTDKTTAGTSMRVQGQSVIGGTVVNTGLRMGGVFDVQMSPGGVWYFEEANAAAMATGAGNTTLTISRPAGSPALSKCRFGLVAAGFKP